jgi:hypothetical protein
MRKRIYIHIGWHKTGSSSIQDFLLRNRQKLIDQEKTYFPEEGLLICAHHPIVWAFQNKKTSPWGSIEIPPEGPEKYIKDIHESAESKGCGTIVLSSEEFCILNNKQISNLHAALENNSFDVIIIAYIRRQDNLIESAYNMEVKWWGTRLRMTFSEYVKARTPYINYTAIVKRWADVFGINNVIIRPFSQEKLVGGDVRIDFCNTLKIDCNKLAITEERMNDSLASQTLEFLRSMNNLEMSREVKEKIVAKLFEYEKREKLPKCVFFTPEERVAFMEKLNEANKAMAHYSDDIDFLSLPNEGLPEKNLKPLSIEEFNKIYQFVMQPIQRANAAKFSRVLI